MEFTKKKKYGQNFLTSDRIPERIVSESGISENDGVLEIGAGFGILTEKLARLAKKVVSVAKRDRQANLLKKIGADDTIYPEREIAEKTGIKYNAKNIYDLIQLTEEYAIYEIPVLVSWVGKTIQEVDVRKNYHVNIIVVKNGDRVTGAPGANYKFIENDHIMILGTQHDVFKLANKT